MSKALVLIQTRHLLDPFAIRPAPLWQAAWALVWAALFLGSAWLLRGRRPFTQTIIPLLLFLFGLYTISLRLIFSPLPFAAQGGLVITLFFAATVLLSFWGLRCARRRHYFQDEIKRLRD
ncbi:MAG: hypothetical protein HND44_12900 [Chloroflexi bacterium]|nr:hypothetical protein [Ardenticatenaceae bacterium]MBL1129377.1 hypothetical protein [Chloroflexota bacterium]NOG35456.1 hypothetical protein [Chloroflexota bacterium]